MSATKIIWKPPKENQVKINFDVAFSNQQKKASVGIVVRNNHGLVMESCTYPLGKSDDPTMTEALACF